MHITKRDGSRVRVSFDKLASKISSLCYNLSSKVLPVLVSQKVISGLCDGVTTSEIDQEAARIAAQRVNHHPHYAILAARLLASDLHQRTPKKFSDYVNKIRAYVHPKTQRHMPLVSDELIKVTEQHKDIIDGAIIHNRDMKFTYFGLCTLMRSYLLRMHDEIVESPQHMYMRVAIGIHGEDIDRVLETYTLLSNGFISHASPTMFNAGTPFPQMASCFLMQLPGNQDSIDDIFTGVHNCARISKTAGGIGMALHSVRARGTYIAGTNGTSNGLVPMLRVFNSTARYVDQGGNKRPGAFAMYLEPWHADVFEFLQMRQQTGQEELRARDLFYALWIPDLFMRRVDADGDWTLMCPHECPGLQERSGPAFDELYQRYEAEGRGQKSIKAQALWFAIIKSLKETGTPYILFKDNANRLSNQQNLGTIQSSNLCVSGDTLILTDEGPRAIKTLAAAPPAAKQRQECEAEVEHLKTQLEADDLPRDQRVALEAARASAAEKLASMPSVDTRPTPVRVWNGKAWSGVTPAKTAEDVELMRVITSHGAVLDCTLQHKFILSDGSRVDAQALSLGQALAASPPIIYPGVAKNVLPDAVAFRRGFVYGYVITQLGTSRNYLAPEPPKSVSVPYLLVQKESVSEHGLALLGYDEHSVRVKFPDQPHDNVAIVEVPENERGLSVPSAASVDTRKQWCAGFLAATAPRLTAAAGSYAMLAPAWSLLRSVGEDARLKRGRRSGKKGVWVLGWPQQEDVNGPPTVVGLERMGVFEDSYCFTEPEEHAGYFNNQLTGQCAEIIEYSAPDEIATCNLASVCLNEFVMYTPTGEASFNFASLHATVKILVVNINRIIDRNLYVLEDMRKSNLRHRPIGIGVQGLADTFAMMRLPWEAERGVPHPQTMRLNTQIFETMYHAAIEASAELAGTDGVYESYKGSPASEGKLQYDLWGVTPTGLWDWTALKQTVAANGLRNSLLLTCMPTASTAQILGNNESFEPFTTNMYTRNVLSGEFQIVNPHLVYDLLELGLWDNAMREDLIRHNGSVQPIERIPLDVRSRYKTVWEISQRTLIDLAAARGAFICQSQSMNLHMRDPTDQQLTSCLFYAWEKQLKTGCYYLRTSPAGGAIKFAIDPDNAEVASEEIDPAVLACSRDNPEACVMCSA